MTNPPSTTPTPDEESDTQVVRLDIVDLAEPDDE
ncbi:hypothetical protein WL1483_523 [Aeromonas schubertii]|uniref:Uncharacterized protein n=1 Tax=Aeromonas schubertii TaxID=652 RepID=A0A0S2SE15_9GAMM|nr:hypothetical protein WL1483_523 [Aeromonas schubertii]